MAHLYFDVPFFIAAPYIVGMTRALVLQAHRCMHSGLAAITTPGDSFRDYRVTWAASQVAVTDVANPTLAA